MAPFDRTYTTFCYLALNNIVTLKSGLSEIGAIRKLGCGFLFAYHSNYGAILYGLRDFISFHFNFNSDTKHKAVQCR